MHNNSTTKYLAYSIALFFILFASIPARSQENNNDNYQFANYEELDSILLAELGNDSSSLLSILEDIINEEYLKSQLSLRAGYSSNITNAGRNFGIQQFGLHAGVAFYHKSGLFADVAGYYNSDQDPKYNTTISSIGYMGLFNAKWNYYLSYDHYFFNQAQNSDYVLSEPLTNSINASSNFLIKKINLGVDYSFIFGEETAHRTRLNLSYSLSSKKTGFIDRINFTPSISLLAGNANVTSVVFNEQLARAKSEELIKEIGKMRFNYLLRNNRELLKTLLSEIQTKNTFGIMNYSIFLPLSFSIKKTTLLLNYSLNLPVALAGEQNLDTTPNSYFSATLLFTLPL